MDFAFEETAVAVCAKRLHDADINVSVVIAKEGFAVEVDESRESVEIVIEKLLAQGGREVGLGVKKKRGDIVLQRTFAAALVIHEIDRKSTRLNSSH